MAKITYIEHSGFLVELDEIALLFDYYTGDVPKTDKPLYIFASHRHHDHFNPEILELECKRTILSNDIRVMPTENIIKIGPNKEIQLDELKISTLKSTDEGVAFIVKYKDKIIYHAGDLHDWYWQGESDEWNSGVEKRYQSRILKGFENIDIVDFAFIPVDSRQGQWYDKGAEFFLQNVSTKHIFPMHFWQDYKCVEAFCEKYRQFNIYKITMPQQAFEIKED